MTVETFEHSTPLPVSAEALFRWHARPGALARLSPPWQTIELLDRGSGLRDGSRVTLLLGRPPFQVCWTAEHRAVTPGRGFEDVQVKGPFASWRHQHLFEPVAEGRSMLRDRIDYRLRGGLAGRLLASRWVERELQRAFDYRHRTTAADLEFHARYGTGPPLRVAISGASGLVGSALTALLTTGGHEVLRLVRRPDGTDDSVVWRADRGVEDLERLEGLDALVHLAGDSISAGRWTQSKKERILNSRVDGTRSLVGSIGRLQRPPGVLVCASAIGFYGERGDEIRDEGAAPGQGFLAGVCRQWEAEARQASALGVRVVLARFGVVLSPQGGALAKMLPAFRLAGGGRIGSGRQFVSWVGIDDACAAIVHAIATRAIAGPVNIVAPVPVTNLQFTRALGRVLRRPTVVPLPSAAARMLFGQMADELLLSSTRVVPGRLEQTGFVFRHPRVEDALAHLLGRVAE